MYSPVYENFGAGFLMILAMAVAPVTRHRKPTQHRPRVVCDSEWSRATARTRHGHVSLAMGNGRDRGRGRSASCLIAAFPVLLWPDSGHFTLRSSRTRFPSCRLELEFGPLA